MRNFKVKSLIFYAVTIASVLLLFNLVTAYGENSLKAPKTIDGRYRLSFAKGLPGCPQTPPLMLQIDQSGNYINAAILKPVAKEAENSMSAEEKLTLTGLFKNQQLNLGGKVAKSVLCDRDQELGESAISINIQTDGDNLAGAIAVNGESTKTPFTAQKQESANPAKSSSH